MTSAASTEDEEARALRTETTVFLSKISTHGCCTLPITCQPLGEEAEAPGDADPKGSGCSWLCVPVTQSLCAHTNVCSDAVVGKR